jgi:hypothetical protein
VKNVRYTLDDEFGARLLASGLSLRLRDADLPAPAAGDRATPPQSSRPAHDVPRPGDLVVATLTYKSTGRATALHARIEVDANGELVAEVAGRELSRLQAFLGSGPAPSSSRIAPAKPVFSEGEHVREVDMPSEFPPAVVSDSMLFTRVLLIGSTTSTSELSALLASSGILTMACDLAGWNDAAVETFRCNAAVVLVERGDEPAAAMPQLRALCTKMHGRGVISIAALEGSPGAPSISAFDLFQLGFDDVVHVNTPHAVDDASKVQARAALAIDDGKTPPVHSTAARVLAVLHRKLKRGARGAA